MTNCFANTESARILPLSATNFAWCINRAEQGGSKVISSAVLAPNPLLICESMIIFNLVPQITGPLCKIHLVICLILGA